MAAAAEPALAQDKRLAPAVAPATSYIDDALSAAAIGRYIRTLTTDTLRDRTTASAALERAASYVADQFRRFGLEAYRKDAPGNPWIQRYPSRGQRRLDFAGSAFEFDVTLQHGGKNVVTEEGDKVVRVAAAALSGAARFAVEVAAPRIPELTFASASKTGGARVMLVSGHQTATTLATAGLAGSVVIYVPPSDLDSTARHTVLTQLHARSDYVFFLGATDAVLGQPAGPQPVALIDWYMDRANAAGHSFWVVELWPPAVRAWLGTAGVDLTQTRVDTTPRARVLPAAEIWLNPQTINPEQPVAATAPNVLGVVEGSDSVLKGEYVVLTASLDNGGAADSVGNRGGGSIGADRTATDHTVGLAMLLALAKALGQPDQRPRRSVLLLAPSGAGEQWAGSHFFIGRKGSLVVNLALSIGGHPLDDSVVVIDGIDDVELPHTPALVAAHAGLPLEIEAAGAAMLPRGGRLPFFQAGIPGLSFEDAASDTMPPRAGVAEGSDTAYASRVAQLVWHLVQEIGNTPNPPHWTAAGRQRLRSAAVPE